VPQVSAQDALGEVLVTGSRIVRQDYEATSPVFTIDAATLNSVGTPQIEQILNELPQLVPTITTTSNNPSLGGQANVDLRGLGTQRTLVLLDGGRLQPSTTGGLIDLNTIPAGLIESIEIMTGGGSATYGSDAIAGVVNIKLRRDFEGIELRAHGGESAESDGRTQGYSAMFGGNFDGGRGNAVVFMSYDKRDEVFAGERDFSTVALGPQLQPLGSTSIPEGYFVPSGTNLPTQAAADAVWGQFGAAPGQVPNTSWVGFNTDTSVFSRTGTVNFQGDTTDPGFNPNDYTYNYSPVNYLQLPLERRQLAAFGRVSISEAAEFYGRMMYTNYQASQELAATPISAGVGTLIPVTNPLIPADLMTLLNSRANPTEDFVFNKRTADVGSRNGTNDYDVIQGLLGMRGDFGVGERSWGWDVSAQWGHTQRTEIQTGNVSRSLLQAAYIDPDALAGDGCTGFNPFGVGNLSPECAAAIAVRASNITEIESKGASAVITGTLFDLPAGPVQTAFGLEYLSLNADFQPDQFLASGDVVGFNAALPVSGKVDSNEAFVEVSIPVLSNMTGIDYLGLDAGYRRSDHNIVGSFDTYMAGLEYKPVESVKLRGSYQRATRAPSVFELFRPQTEGFPAYRDPCWDNSLERLGPDAAQVNALCAAQGAGASFPQGNSQVRALSGGNPDLDPEFADTYTFGVAWQPSLGDNTVRVAVDWFSYELDDTIGSVGASTIVTRCFNAQGANPTYDNSNLWCQLFSRSTAGIAEDVLQTDQNLGVFKAEGIDFQLDYSRPFGPGEFRAGLALTHLTNWERQEDPASPLVAVDGTITINVAEAFPDLKGILNLGYQYSDFDFGWTVRYIAGMDVVNNDAARTLSADSCGAILPPTCLPPVATTVPSYDYHRFTAGWQATEGLRLALGVDNLFDKDPPIYTTNSRAGVQANTDPSTYDVLGRRYFVSATYKF
jgi:outer membrane receptor protein involved in Fe transport